MRVPKIQMKTSWFIAISGAVLLLSAGMLWGQVELGTISGIVRDPSGAVVPAASVTVTNVDTGVPFKTTTTAGGEYVAPNLIPGSYSVTVTAAGFSTLVRRGISLHVNERLEVDLELQVGATSQQVTITAEASLLQNESSEVQILISRQDIADLPLNGRSVFQLAPLAAGVTNGIPGENANNTSIPNNARAGQGLAVNGLPQSTNSYVLDGVYNDQEDQGLMAIIPPLEAVQEFKLETSNFLPEIGRGGGVMNIIIKSGSDRFHGELFEFLRNSALDARNFFDYTAKRLPNFVQNQFGGTFGGPIKKDNTFFFFDYQGFRQRQGETDVSTVPGALIRGGNFSGTTNLIYDPATYSASANTRQPFANQTIGTGRFSLAAAKILNMIPLPNGPLLSTGEGYYYSTASKQSNEFNYDIKIDHTFSNRDSFTGRWSLGESHSLLPGAFSAVAQDAPAVGIPISVTGGVGSLTGTVSNPSVNLGLSEIHDFSPRMINEARGAFVRSGSNSRQLGYGQNYADQLGIPNVNVSQTNTGFPFISISGASGIGDPGFFLIETENVFEGLDNVTIIAGAHTFKAGVDFKKMQRQFTQQISSAGAGTFTFNPTFTESPALPSTTGNAFADFLLGDADSASLEHMSGLAGLRTTEFAAYWQDTWRMTRKLTANYGIRYDLFTPQTEVHNRYDNFDLATAILVLPGTSGSNPNLDNRALIRTNKHNFAPRLGLAYSPTSKTVVRVAYGVFYFPESVQSDVMTLNPPFVGATTYANVGVPQNISETLDQGFPVAITFTPINQYTGGINCWDPDNRTGYSQEWTFGAQRQLTANTMLEIDYVGSESIHLQQLHNVDAAVPGNGSTVSREPYGPLVGRIFNAKLIEDRGVESYEGLNLIARRNFAHGITFFGSYTWSHAVGDPFGPWGNIFSTESPYNMHADRGNMGMDLRHRFVANWLYELPVGHGKRWNGNASGLLNALVGGWELGGVGSITSGAPYTVLGGANYPNRVCNGNTPSGGHTVHEWFDISCFPLPPSVPDPVHGGVYTPYGDSGANILYGPHFVDFDISAIKSFAISESKRIEFRSEFFDAFNEVNFSAPAATVNTGTTGQLTAAGPARQIQMVLKFTF